MTEEQAKSVSGCPFCYTKKGIVMRAPSDTGENHQETVMAAKSAPKKAAAKPAAAKKAPKVEKVAAKVVEAEKPVVKDEITLVDTPPAKKGVKAYAAKVLAEKAAKDGAAESPIISRLKKEDAAIDAKDAERLEKLAKKETALAAFTKNGAPAATGDDEFDAIQSKAYNDYVSKCKADIIALKIPVGKDSAANHIVVFGKDGVARKVSAEEGAKQLAKSLSKEAKAQKDPDASRPKCICKECTHNEGIETCKKCDGNTDEKCLIPDLPCTEKRTNGRKSCVQNAIDQGYSLSFVADLRNKWNVDKPISTPKKQLAPADAPNVTKLTKASAATPAPKVEKKVARKKA